jgi:tRNA(Ile)-lysidine synthase
MSRGASLTTIVRRALEPGRGEASLARGSVVLVAVSGGPDSMALLSIAARLAPRLGLAVRAHGVDHGLRPEAAKELDLAERFATAIGVPWDRTCVAVPRGGNLQERARTLRWRALVAAALPHGATIATAHHADDRAETVLIRVLRGAGVRGLAVLPARALAPGGPEVAVIRPLLRARRTDVLLHLERHGVPSAIDPSNTDPRYLRTRVRRELLPLLEQLDPNIVEHLSSLAEECVRASAPDEWGAPGLHAALPRPTQEALASLIRTGSRTARVWLPGGLVVSLDPRARPVTRTPERRARRMPREPDEDGSAKR